MVYPICKPDGYGNGFSLEPGVRNFVGNPNVSYIYEDHVNNNKVADAMMKMYDLGPEKRKLIGQQSLKQARERFSLHDTVSKWDETLGECIKNWDSARPKWTIEEIKNRDNQ